MGGLNLNPTPVYANNVNAGLATATVNFAATGNYAAASASGSVTIAPAPTTTMITCANTTFDGTAKSPCTAGVTGAGAPGSPTITYTDNTAAGTAGATAAYVQVGCFASPVYSTMPDTKSAQRKGSNLPSKCTLQTPQGAAVTTATANIQVIDAGTTASNPPVRTGNVVLTVPNAMKYSNSGNDAYGLDTSPAVFIAGHYYYVIADWNDGAKTEGWFLLK